MDIIGHYYSPIPFYKGKVLKYGGLATKNNAWVMEQKPGTIILPEYKGDRIDSETHEDYGNQF